MRRKRIDPLARRAALAMAAGRIAIGVGTNLATRRALKGLGFAETDASGRALAKLAGGRDLALGALTLAARDDLGALRQLTLAAAAFDAADAVTLGLGLGNPVTREAAVKGIASGGAAAAGGLWAWRRLGG